MKKVKFFALIALISIFLPLSVMADEDITSTGSSNMDATIESIAYTESTQTLMVYWGDFKFDFKTKSVDNGDIQISSWSPASLGTTETLASNRVQVLSTFVSPKKATLSFAPNISDVSAQIFGSVSNPTGVITTTTQQLEAGALTMSENETADYSVYLIGGRYENVLSEYNNGAKKIGTFTITIEDAE